MESEINELRIEISALRHEIELLRAQQPTQKIPVVHPMDAAHYNLSGWVEGRDYKVGVGF